MKKIASIILVLAMVLGLCACGGTGEGSGDTAAVEGLQVGYAREKIMPETEVPLGGYGNGVNRISTGYLDYLYATCIAFSENGETVLLFTQDLLRSVQSWTNEARDLITGATGVPADHIQFSATHTHSSPDMTTSDDSRTKAWKEIYMAAVVKAAQDAVADLSPATLSGAKTQTENMNFVRHYLLSDNSYGGDNFGDFTNNSIVDHAVEGDHEMLLVKITRAVQDKQDIVIMNYQAHPCFTGGSKETNISADFIGSTRDAFEKETDMLFAYFTGAAGDQNVTSRISGENHHLNLKEYGAKLAQIAIAALETATPIEGEGIKTTQMLYTYDCNKEGLEKLKEAKEVADLYSQTGDTTTANALAKQYGFSSVFEARGVVAHASNPDSATMELNAVYVAGMAFITAPYEMFSESAKYIKSKSPFDMTLMCTCANDMPSYYPTKMAYDYGCYESYTAKFAPGVAEDTADQFVQMLNTLK